MAIVTEYTFGKLVSKFEIKNLEEYISREFFFENIYPNYQLFSFFSQSDLRRLYNYKFFLENHEDLEVYEFVERQPDTGRYVFNKGGNLKYHLYDDCETLHSNYIDFIVPVEVNERDLLEEYREWFKKNLFKEKYESGAGILELFTQNYNSTFAKKYKLPELNIKYTLVEDKPAGKFTRTDDEFNREDFEEKFDELILHKQYLCNSNTLKFLSFSDYLFKRSDEEIIERIQSISSKHPEVVASCFLENYSIIKLRAFWQEHYKLKSELFKLLSNYFRWTYNLKGANFKEYTLESFGLTCCYVCDKRRGFNPSAI